MKKFLTTCTNCFMHNMLAKIFMLVKVCDICQETIIKSLKNNYARIPVYYSPMESLLVDIKFLMKGFGDFNSLLVATG